MNNSKLFFRFLVGLLLASLALGGFGRAGLSALAAPKQASALDVIISEIAWGGTIAFDSDEWIELYNPGLDPINFDSDGDGIANEGNWYITSNGKSPNLRIILTGTIAPGQYYLLERINDTVVKPTVADQIYDGPGNFLDDIGDTLYLYAPNGSGGYDIIDTVNGDGGAWPAGTATGYGSMERYGVYSDMDSVWVTNPNPDANGTVDFRDNSIYGTPKSENWAFTITPLTTTTITADNPDPSVIGAPVTVSVSVIGGPTIPSGAVDIVGGNQSCTVSLNNGKGKCDLTFMTEGNKTITAKYNGDATHASSTDNETHQVVPPISTKTEITSIYPNPALVGNSIRVTFKVSNKSQIPTGTVEISGADNNCSASLASNGVGSCNISFSSVGVKSIKATYLGYGAFVSSEDTDTVDVFRESITTITDDRPDPSETGQEVTVTVIVAGEERIPTGTVDITGANSNCTITLEAGTGSCQVKFSYSGTKYLTATYSGDNYFISSYDTEIHVVSFVSSTIPRPVQPSPVLVLNEFLPRPGRDWNQDGLIDVNDEFIEVMNAGSINVNLREYRLDDGDQGSAPFSLPNIILKPGESYIFYRSDTGILLNDSGNTVRLFRGSKIVDAYTYGVVRYPDESWCRIPDGEVGSIFWNHPCFPTPNNPNALTGRFSASPGYSGSPFASVCFMPDGAPQDFVQAECVFTNGRGIWNRLFWDDPSKSEIYFLTGSSKWGTFFQ